jgi:hypothetical protein
MSKTEGISVKELYHLKHQANQSITYGRSNQNAQQVKELENLTNSQAEQLRESLKMIRKEWWLIPDWVWVCGILVAITLVWISREPPYLTSAFVIFGYCLGQVAFRAGHQEGFVRGFEDGNTSGAYKALGITDEDTQDLDERSIEMQLDDAVIKKMNERRDTL